MKDFQLPEFWYVRVTNENRDILNEWRLERATHFLDNRFMSARTSFLLSDLYTDGSHYYGSSCEEELNRAHPKYKKITFEQFKKYVLKKSSIDYKIPGTIVPQMLKEVEYRVSTWFDDTINSMRTFKSKTPFVSYGFKEYKGEIYILFEVENYEKSHFWMVKESYLNQFNTAKEEIKTITYEEAQSIINIACSTWKDKLAEKWSVQIVKKENISVSNEDYKEMRAACNASQNILLDEIFGKEIEHLKEGTPCFARDVDSDYWKLVYADGNGQFKKSKEGRSNRWKQVIVISEGIPEY